MVFASHNLVSDGPFNEFHLIMCRNVMIYFDAELRRRVHGLLYDSLARFGFLTLGNRESLAQSELRDRYRDFALEHRLYRKVA
jgi:chemotaxis protein methyltransferase CheR